MSENRPTIGVAIIARNEEKNLARLLPSVGFADEIVLVENDSTDKTVALAKAHGVKVFSRDWSGYAAARNYSVSQTTSDWVLILDADEYISNELASEITQAIKNPLIDGYFIAFQHMIGDQTLRHGGWYPDWHLRLIRKTYAFFPEQAIHESITNVPRPGYLKHPIIHFTYQSIAQWVEKANRYTDLE